MCREKRRQRAAQPLNVDPGSAGSAGEGFVEAAERRAVADYFFNFFDHAMPISACTYSSPRMSGLIRTSGTIQYYRKVGGHSMKRYNKKAVPWFTKRLVQ